MGASESEVKKSSDVEPETAACVNAFNASAEASRSFALGMIYGYESQTPAVAETKIVGLRDHYGIEGAAADYFQLHGEPTSSTAKSWPRRSRSPSRTKQS